MKHYVDRLIPTALNYCRVLEWKIDSTGNPNRYRRGWCDKHGFVPKNLVTVVVEGDAMSPSIEHGMSVVINTSDNAPSSGKVYAVVYQGAFLIRRLYIEIDGTIHLKSDNPDKKSHPRLSIAFRYREVLQILGRVVQAQDNL
ncbi:S24 family peptidase [Chitinimonas sp. PSY-7]|uniref:S24 family peptidase n=1 Tax=Chitinimonas sp. PSY-7 TaxID=3459088 RepID=UPI0040400BF0